MALNCNKAAATHSVTWMILVKVDSSFPQESQCKPKPECQEPKALRPKLKGGNFNLAEPVPVPWAAKPTVFIDPGFDCGAEKQPPHELSPNGPALRRIDFRLVVQEPSMLRVGQLCMRESLPITYDASPTTHTHTHTHTRTKTKTQTNTETPTSTHHADHGERNFSAKNICIFGSGGARLGGPDRFMPRSLKDHLPFSISF